MSEQFETWTGVVCPWRFDLFIFSFYIWYILIRFDTCTQLWPLILRFDILYFAYMTSGLTTKGQGRKGDIDASLLFLDPFVCQLESWLGRKTGRTAAIMCAFDKIAVVVPRTRISQPHFFQRTCRYVRGVLAQRWQTRSFVGSLAMNGLASSGVLTGPRMTCCNIAENAFHHLLRQIDWRDLKWISNLRLMPNPLRQYRTAGWKYGEWKRSTCKVTPDGLTFSIWAVIYTLELVLVARGPKNMEWCNIDCHMCLLDLKPKLTNPCVVRAPGHVLKSNEVRQIQPDPYVEALLQQSGLVCMFLVRPHNAAFTGWLIREQCCKCFNIFIPRTVTASVIVSCCDVVCSYSDRARLALAIGDGFHCQWVSHLRIKWCTSCMLFSFKMHQPRFLKHVSGFLG